MYVYVIMYCKVIIQIAIDNQVGAVMDPKVYIGDGQKKYSPNNT